ncbi:hypothetical protein DL98DRAFT_656424 [Cadophora sp. DSE1049]|nr:hypothetical protein DL98DRAFT_656424 [Cadophora sp. DSE1049]
MPLFDPDTDLDFGDDVDFDLHTSSDGYASAESLGFGVEVDGIHLPLRGVSQLEHTSPQSTPPESPRNSTPPTYTRGPSRSPASQPHNPSSPNNNQHRNNNMNPSDRDLASQLKNFLEEEEEEDIRPPGRRSRLTQKGMGRVHQADDEEEGEDEEEEEEQENNGDGEVVQVEHHDRWQPDFGKIRPKIPESMLSFIRDGYEVLKDTEVVCFKPNGGAFKPSTRKQSKKKEDDKQGDKAEAKKKVGRGQVWITKDEAFLRDAVTWAIGGYIGKSNHDPAYLNSYEGARRERDEELNRWLDSARYAGNMDAPRMAANRRARRQAVESLLDQYGDRKATIARAKDVVNAIAGKTVDYDELKARIKDPETHGYGFGPLPAALQVDPIYLPLAEQTQQYKDGKVKEYTDWKENADGVRKAKGWAAKEARAS